MIQADVLYQPEELRNGMGWKEQAYSQALRLGLPCMKIGRRTYFSGAEVIEWLRNTGSRRGTIQRDSE